MKLLVWAQAILFSLSLVGSVPHAMADESEGQVTTDDIAQGAKETLKATKEYTIQQKEAFYKKMDEELKKAQAEIDKLKAKSEKASVGAREALNKMIAGLEKEKAEAAKKLEDLKNATAEAWGDMKAQMNSAMKDLKRSVKRVLSRLD